MEQERREGRNLFEIHVYLLSHLLLSSLSLNSFSYRPQPGSDGSTSSRSKSPKRLCSRHSVVSAVRNVNASR